MAKITLGNYKGLEVPKIVIEVSEDEINSELERARQMAAEKVEVEKAENGDEVVIDFVGYLDGEAFEGGKGEKYPLTLGSGSFIPGFEEQLVGTVPGDDVDVVVTFPENYQAENLAGKETTFKVKVHGINREVVPEMNDEFVSRIAPCSTLDELSQLIESSLKAKKENDAKNHQVEVALEKLIETCEIEVEEAIVKEQIEVQLQRIEEDMQANGLTIEQYLQFTGSNMDTLKENLRAGAEVAVKNTEALKEIARVEAVEVAKEEIDKYIEQMAASYKRPVEELSSMLTDNDMKNIAEDIRLSKTIDLIMSNAVQI